MATRRAIRGAGSKAPTVRREGVQVRHARRCDMRGWAACSCSPSYQAQVWSPRDRRPIRKSFATIAEAVAWRQEAQVSLRRGTLRAPTVITLREAAQEWLEAAEAGIVRTRSGDPYKPSALRSYRQALTTCRIWSTAPQLPRLKTTYPDGSTSQLIVCRVLLPDRVI